MWVCGFFGNECGGGGVVIGGYNLASSNAFVWAIQNLGTKRLVCDQQTMTNCFNVLFYHMADVEESCTLRVKDICVVGRLNKIRRNRMEPIR